MAIVKAAIVQHAHHVRSIVIVRLAHPVVLVTALSAPRVASVIALSAPRAASVTDHRVRQVHAPVDSPVVQDHEDHRAMAIVLNVVLSTKARLVQAWSNVATLQQQELRALHVIAAMLQQIHSG
jgi:hypothetical protein